MKIKNSFLNCIKIIVSILICSFPFTAFAKTISLYEQPKSDAKVLTSVDLSAGIIPIYKPKEGDWVKVADPKNGNVGWVKSSELNNAISSQSTFTVTQSISKDNTSPNTYRIIQFGQPTNLTPEQTQSMIKQMQRQQQAFQKSMWNMLHDMDRLFYDDWHLVNQHVPVLMPIMIVPVQKNTNMAQTHQPNKQFAQTQASTPIAQVQKENPATDSKK